MKFNWNKIGFIIGMAIFVNGVHFDIWWIQSIGAFLMGFCGEIIKS